MANHKTSKLQPLINRVSTPLFARFYFIFSLAVVLATTIFWSLLGTKLQNGNADQLVDPSLFKTVATFRGATFPGAHTMLIKWPIFWLINLFGSGTAAIETFTVILTVLTVAVLVAVIYRIERRPFVFGTICLALASVLLLVPAAPYAGGILPVNMAMLTTRNIEYAIFVLSLILLIRSPKVRSWGFWLSAAVLSLLVASDKLFLVLAVGGASIALIIYAKSRVWPLVSLAVNLIFLGAIAAIGSYLILQLISGTGLTHLTNAASASPYSLSSTPKDIVLGVIYGIMGVLTNFGANPAFAATEVKNIPSQFIDHLFSFAGPAYVINIAILLIGLVVVYRVVMVSWRQPKPDKRSSLNKHRALSLILIWSSVVAAISFVFSNHYYAVDARYLTIILFAVIISVASYTRNLRWRPQVLVAAGAIITIGIIFGVIGATKSYNSDQAALAPQNSRNQTISQALIQNHDTLLVGDYWRVIPIKQDTGSSLTVTPLANCTTPLEALDSTEWKPSLSGNKFTYLLTLSGSLTNYPNCSLKQVISAYGKPNGSTLISGTLSKPNELLLSYDRGTHKSSPVVKSSDTPTVLPISPSQLPYTTCPVPSVVNIVAHEDDDLLFMSPDLINEIKAGYCVRTVYVTAGNAGLGEFYWLGREKGAEAAYSSMLGSKAIWIQRIVELAPNEFITVANPRQNSKISLIFMHLPDGNLKGQGFGSSDFESLVKLEKHQINVINSVDKQSYYSSSQLISALSNIMDIYQPSLINTQSSFVGTKFPDHSDHLAVSWFVNQAYSQFETQKYDNRITIPIKFYEGYPGRQSPANVSGALLQEKEAAFTAYSKYDADVCQSLQICLQTPTYNGYLNRQYVNPY